MKFEFHPLANLLPLIEGAEFDELVDDIRKNGLQDHIDIYQGKILDGRNRYRAAEAAGVALETWNIRHYRPEMYGDPVAFVISKNLKRRHLNESQRASVAAKLANLGVGRPTETAQSCAISQDAAADRMAVSRRSVQHAATVHEHGTPGLRHALDHGKISVSQAAIAARLNAPAQERIAERANAGDENAARSIIKQQLRADREVDLAQRQEALPTKRYGVIYADPEWRFEVYSRETGMDRAADNHYPTSATEAICARPVGEIATDDCVLFLWATAPMMPDALRVMTAWGFEYKSQSVWVKDRIGTGYWFRNQHELLLVGTRGKVPAPAMGTHWPSVIEAPVGKHSAKPDRFYELIEEYFPNLPKIELNARRARDGWDAWGNEAPSTSPHDPDTGEVAEEIPAGVVDYDDTGTDIPEFLGRVG